MPHPPRALPHHPDRERQGGLASFHAPSRWNLQALFDGATFVSSRQIKCGTSGHIQMSAEQRCSLVRTDVLWLQTEPRPSTAGPNRRTRFISILDRGAGLEPRPHQLRGLPVCPQREHLGHAHTNKGTSHVTERPAGLIWSYMCHGCGVFLLPAAQASRRTHHRPSVTLSSAQGAWLSTGHPGWGTQ